eukprot:6195243-Pleurochrysis_carterae.AAC.2
MGEKALIQGRGTPERRRAVILSRADGRDWGWRKRWWKEEKARRGSEREKASARRRLNPAAGRASIIASAGCPTCQARRGVAAPAQEAPASASREPRAWSPRPAQASVAGGARACRRARSRRRRAAPSASGRAAQPARRANMRGLRATYGDKLARKDRAKSCLRKRNEEQVRRVRRQRQRWRKCGVDAEQSCRKREGVRKGQAAAGREARVRGGCVPARRLGGSMTGQPARP